VILCKISCNNNTSVCDFYKTFQVFFPRSRRDELPILASPNPLCDEFLPVIDPNKSRRDPVSKAVRSNADMFSDKSDMSDLND